MTRVACQTTIHVPADAIWQVISDFGAACQYMVGVVSCMVEGKGIGALRTLTSADGSVIVERLEALDTINRRLSYLLLTDTPFRNCLTTVLVHDLGPGQAELEWLATFEADGLPADEALEMLESARLVPLYTRYTFRDELQLLFEQAGFEMLEVYRDYEKNPYDGTGELISVTQRPR